MMYFTRHLNTPKSNQDRFDNLLKLQDAALRSIKRTPQKVLLGTNEYTVHYNPPLRFSVKSKRHTSNHNIDNFKSINILEYITPLS